MGVHALYLQLSLYLRTSETGHAYSEVCSYRGSVGGNHNRTLKHSDFVLQTEQCDTRLQFLSVG